MSNLKIKFSEFVSLVGPIGHFPIAPGTMSSFSAACLGLLINVYFGSDATLFLAILTGILGWYTSKIYIEKIDDKDPSEVVIDEFSGQLFATAAAGTSLLFNFIAFILFRFFDILKPGIIKKAEKLSGSLGIMMDDWLAGVISALFLLFFSSFGQIKYNWFIM
jgi:phosphatidylglycerophosphatase A